MFTRLRYTLTAAAGLALGSLGVVAVPAVAWGWAVLGVFIGVVVGSLRARGAAGGAVCPGIGAGRRVGVRAGGSTFAGGLVLTGLVTLLGPASGSVILTLLLLAALLAWRRWYRRGGQPAAEDSRTAGCPEVVPIVAPLPPLRPPLPPLLTPEALSTQELCLAWRRSYLTLLDLPPGPARWEIVRIRQCLLDELERRDRDGFTRWLDAGARASSDPGRYLTDQ